MSFFVEKKMIYNPLGFSSQQKCALKNIATRRRRETEQVHSSALVW